MCQTSVVSQFPHVDPAANLVEQTPALDPTWFFDTTMTQIRVNRLNGEVLEVILTEKRRTTWRATGT